MQSIKSTPQTYKSPSFKGYDARQLKAVVLNTTDRVIFSQMKEIGKKNGFEVISARMREFTEKLMPKDWIPSVDMWAQDIATITPDKKVVVGDWGYSMAEFIRKKFRKPIRYNQNYDAGGNFFYVKKEGKEILLIGEDSAEQFTNKELCKLYGADKAVLLPQMDYHADLFIRPLDEGKVLLVDDKLTLKLLQKIISKAKKTLTSPNTASNLSYNEEFQLTKIVEYTTKIKNKFSKNVKLNRNAQTEEIEKLLKNEGLEVIRVPGRIYEIDQRNYDIDILSQGLNYLNGIVHKRKDGELVYITNKANMWLKNEELSTFERFVNMNYEAMFKDSIKPFVKPENVHFMNIGSTLENLMGGIHCLSMEVPK